MFRTTAFWRRLIAWGRSRDDNRVRRVIVVVLEGLDLELVERYLDEGLLHHLALLSDLGTRVALDASPASILDSLSQASHKNRLRSIVLSADPIATNVDLHSICIADRAQQERFFAALSRRLPALVAAVFDMPRQLQRLFGPQPNPDEQLLLRDIYVRMDEVVGKAFSFVDETTALVAVVAGGQCAGTSNCESAVSRLYVSRTLSPRCSDHVSLSEVVLELLKGSICRI